MTEFLLPLAGLFLVLIAHLAFYASSFWSESGLTGLLKIEEDLLMDSMVVIGGIQATYFLWRSIGAFSGNYMEMTALTDTIGFVLLGFFTYVSYRMVVNGKDIVSTYSVETSWGEEDGS